MRPVMVVAMAPDGEGLLGVEQALEVRALQQLEVEGAVEAFVLARGSGDDAGRTVPARHAVLDHQMADHRVSWRSPVSPHGGPLSVRITWGRPTGSNADCTALCTVARRWLSTACRSRHSANGRPSSSADEAGRRRTAHRLEVHLPHRVGSACSSASRPCVRRHHLLNMPVQDLGDPRLCQRRYALPPQAVDDLAPRPTPDWPAGPPAPPLPMRPVRPRRRAMRTARPIGQSRPTN